MGVRPEWSAECAPGEPELHSEAPVSQFRTILCLTLGPGPLKFRRVYTILKAALIPGFSI